MSWIKVVFAAECDEDGNCPVCLIDYGDCGCPGPTQDDLYDYEERDGVLWARRREVKDNKWDVRFMEVAKLIATWSKDRSRQTGCVIVGPEREIRTTGYNGFPRFVNDEVEERHLRPAKYLWTEHAERNAIYNAARIGVSLASCTAYVPWYPCMDCARSLIQAGIITLVAYRPDFNDPKWGEEFRNVEHLLEEGGVATRFVNGTVGEAK